MVQRASAKVILVALALACYVACGGPQWRIDSVRLNPAGPLGGVDPVTPVELVAPPAGDRGGPYTIRNVDLSIVVSRSSGYTGDVWFRAKNDIYPPGGGHTLSQSSGDNVIDGTSTRKTTVFLNVFCKRIENPAAEHTVELNVDGVTVTGTSQAQAEVDVQVESSADHGVDGWPVTWRAPRRLPVVCRRESPIG